MAGKREKGWNEAKKYSETVQRTDDLFDEWLRLLRGLYPRSFIAENVPGLIAGASLGEYAHHISRRLGEIGYRVSAEVLNSAHYSVPQSRQRLIFMGLRSDLFASAPTFPSPITNVPFTLRQALDDVDSADPDHAPFLEESSMEPYAVGKAWHFISRYGTDHLRDASEKVCLACGKGLYSHSGIDPAAENPYASARCEDGGMAEPQTLYFLLTVPELDKPSPTLSATAAQVGAASLCHPTECRKLTPAEAKAISGFPADFILTGTAAQRVERMGRAVTPPLYAAVGSHLARYLA
jgi:DNA (cytosine-5)-methyltransferase 1